VNHPPTQRAAQLKERYGGEWALITDNTDPTTRHLAVELAKAGYNLIFIVRKDGAKDAKRITPASNKFGVQVEFITAESYFAMTAITEEALRDKDLAIVVTGLVYDPNHASKSDKEQQDLLSLSLSQ
jgi:short-subunit dehydrogenase